MALPLDHFFRFAHSGVAGDVSHCQSAIMVDPIDPTALRAPRAEDYAALARLWCNGWREAHAAFVPEDLVKLRTLENFHERLLAFGDGLRLIGPAGAPSGFCAIRASELDQLFVAPAARGTGIAQRLLADGERRLAENGAKVARLVCIEENQRAMRFYHQNGWDSRGMITEEVQTSAGLFPLAVILFEKALAV